jgi:predicted metal-dependent enzyme (double-stranded beta helix superfamily)
MDDVLTPNRRERLVQLSFDGMEGGASAVIDTTSNITTFEALVENLDVIFEAPVEWESRQSLITKLLGCVKLPSTEVKRYVHWNKDLPYTRNLVATDGKNYTLLILCWNSGRESRIHNHPCQGCFVLPLSGSIVETLYYVHPEDDEIRQGASKMYGPGQVTFMNDAVGLHKIGTTSESGAVSLHLYTPPFFNCKVLGASLF